MTVLRSGWNFSVSPDLELFQKWSLLSRLSLLRGHPATMSKASPRRLQNSIIKALSQQEAVESQSLPHKIHLLITRTINARAVAISLIGKSSCVCQYALKQHALSQPIQTTTHPRHGPAAKWQKPTQSTSETEKISQFTLSLWTKSWSETATIKSSILQAQ